MNTGAQQRPPSVAAGLLGALIGVLLVAGLAALLLSHSRSGPANAGSPPRAITRGEGAGSAGAFGGAGVSPEHPVDIPLTREEQLREDLSRKRLPFYRYLHDNFGDVIDRFSVLDDPDTLDLVVGRSDDATLNTIVSRAIAPRAGEYGFRRVRFYVRNPDTSVTPFSVIAEATDDGTGHWSTFKK